MKPTGQGELRDLYWLKLRRSTRSSTKGISLPSELGPILWRYFKEERGLRLFEHAGFMLLKYWWKNNGGQQVASERIPVIPVRDEMQEPVPCPPHLKDNDQTAETAWAPVTPARRHVIHWQAEGSGGGGDEEGQSCSFTPGLELWKAAFLFIKTVMWSRWYGDNGGHGTLAEVEGLWVWGKLYFTLSTGGFASRL